jgi:hypothetical protein
MTAVGAVYAMRYRNEVTHLAFIESALAGARQDVKSVHCVVAAVHAADGNSV